MGPKLTDEGLQGIALTPQVQPEPDQLKAWLRTWLEGQAEGELTRIGVEFIHEQKTQVGPHGMRLANCEALRFLHPKVVDRTASRDDDAVFVQVGVTMRNKLLFLSILATLPLSAGEFGLLLDKQFGKAQALSGKSYDAVSPTGFGLRGGVDVLDLKVAALQLNATWHNKTTGDLNFGSGKVGELDNQYWAAGAMVNWKLLVNVGAGVEYRSEKLSWRSNLLGAPILGAGGGDTTTGRPWAKVNIGFSIPTPVVSPFFVVEVAAPLSKKDSASTTKDLSEALAPQVQIGVYGGIRF
jgi:hypothetical protein